MRYHKTKTSGPHLKGMSMYVPKGGVCVRSDLGSPMANTSPKTPAKATKKKGKSSKVSNVSDSVKDSVKDCVSKDSQVSKVSKDCKNVSHAVPKFNSAGQCSRCKSLRNLDESITCGLCGDLFHAVCLTRKGTLDDQAICPKGFLDKVRPAMAHWGKFSDRWGNFMFHCNKCSQKIKSLSKSNHSRPSDTQNLRLQKSVEVQVGPIMIDSDHSTPDFNNLIDGGNVTTPIRLNSDDTAVEETPPVSNIVASVSNVVTKNVESMLGNFKDNILNSMEEIIAVKLQTALATVSPISSSFRQRAPSTDSTPSLSSGSNVSLLHSDVFPRRVSIDDDSLTSTSDSSSSVIEFSSCTDSGIESNSAVPNIRESSTMKPLSSDLASSKSYKEVLTSNLDSPGELPANPMAKCPSQLPLVDGSDHIVVLKVDEVSTTLAEVENMADKALKNIPVNFIEGHPRSNKVIVSFPSTQHKGKGMRALTESKDISEGKITVSEAKKMFPKITVTNIPNSLLSPITSLYPTLPPHELREKLKPFLEDKFLEKNENVQNLVSCQNRTFKIVYVKVGRNYTTVGIKVSPDIRHMLTSQKCIFIGYTKCSVTDRFDFIQCFRCQRIGHHKSDTCKEPNVICMFCSGSHVTGSCPYKDERQRYRCTNCSHSTVKEERDSCNTHHSGEDVCPTIQQEKEKLKQRTEYSKNM